MYIQSQQLGDLGKFKLGKKLKKAVKKVGRVAKKAVKTVGKVAIKVAPVVAIGAAAWFAVPAIGGLIAKVGPAAAKLIASRAAAKRQQETGAPPESASPAEMQAYLNEAAAEYQRASYAPAAGGGGYMPAAYDASEYGNGVAPTMSTEQQAAPLPQWVVPAAIGVVALLMLQRK